MPRYHVVTRQEVARHYLLDVEGQEQASRTAVAVDTPCDALQDDAETVVECHEVGSVPNCRCEEV